MKSPKVIGMCLFTLLMFTLTIPCFSQGKEDDRQNKALPKEGTEVNSEAENREGMPVVMVMNGTEVKATLNNTLTAREFAKLLPYSVTVSRATDDLCGSVGESLPSDPSEGQNSWKIGEIGWFGGWFTILVDHEERFYQMPGVMIIGRISDEDLSKVTGLTGRVDITVRAE